MISWRTWWVLHRDLPRESLWWKVAWGRKAAQKIAQHCIYHLTDSHFSESESCYSRCAFSPCLMFIQHCLYGWAKQYHQSFSIHAQRECTFTWLVQCTSKEAFMASIVATPSRCWRTVVYETPTWQTSEEHPYSLGKRRGCLCCMLWKVMTYQVLVCSLSDLNGLYRCLLSKILLMFRWDGYQFRVECQSLMFGMFTVRRWFHPWLGVWSFYYSQGPLNPDYCSRFQKDIPGTWYSCLSPQIHTFADNGIRGESILHYSACSAVRQWRQRQIAISSKAVR